MNLKGNVFSLGFGETVSAAKKDGICHIFLRRSGPVAYMQFNPAARTLKSIGGAVSYGDYCRSFDGVMAEYTEGQLSYSDI